MYSKNTVPVLTTKIICRFILLLSICATWSNSLHALKKWQLFISHILRILCLLEKNSTFFCIKTSSIDVDITWQLKIKLVEGWSIHFNYPLNCSILVYMTVFVTLCLKHIVSQSNINMIILSRTSSSTFYVP